MQKSEKNKEDNQHKVPLHITDTTLRDAHQSLWATRMRTDDIMKIIDVVDNVGYYSLEVWGGATFDVCLRFLRENPWERLRLIKSKAKKTPLQMLLRGQNLVGYRNYADDVVDRFVALACENGMDIFRVFDALNDSRNLATAIKAVKKYGGHAQGTLSYTISPVHTVELFVKAAKEQVDLGIESLCIKDMAGILTPIAAEKLVKALIEKLNIPIQIHSHATSGMSVATYLESVKAGAGAIDCAISSMAGFSSQPPVETMYAIFKETDNPANLDLDALRKINKYFEDLFPKRMQGALPKCIIDPEILIHQIPGGMISNFRSQLEKQNALDKLSIVLEEVAKVRKDLGYPPLVTPTSQIVGTQAVMNVLAGERYKIVPNEVKDYLKGLYGRSPAQPDQEIVKKILGNEKIITHRPADDIDPMLKKAADDVDPKLIKHEEDIISFCILPEPALEYFKWRAMPQDQKPEIPADKEMRVSKEADKKIEESEEAENTSPALIPTEHYAALSELVKSAGFDSLTVIKGGVELTLKTSTDSGTAQNGSEPVKSTRSETKVLPALGSNKIESKPETSPKIEKNSNAPVAYSKTINAPFVGTFYSNAGSGKPRFVEEGGTINAGDPVCIVEAMKLFNQIKANAKCKIVKFLVKDGDHVEKDQPLVGIEEI